jgi:hypothetical protein
VRVQQRLGETTSTTGSVVHPERWRRERTKDPSRRQIFGSATLLSRCLACVCPSEWRGSVRYARHPNGDDPALVVEGVCENDKHE